MRERKVTTLSPQYTNTRERNKAHLFQKIKRQPYFYQKKLVLQADVLLLKLKVESLQKFT